MADTLPISCALCSLRIQRALRVALRTTKSILPSLSQRCVQPALRHLFAGIFQIKQCSTVQSSLSQRTAAALHSRSSNSQTFTPETFIGLASSLIVRSQELCTKRKSVDQCKGNIPLPPSSNGLQEPGARHLYRMLRTHSTPYDHAFHHFVG